MSTGNLRATSKTATEIWMRRYEQYEAEMMVRRLDEDERNMRSIVGREQFVDAQRLMNEYMRMMLDNVALSVPAAILVNRDFWQEFARERKAKKSDPNAAMIARDEKELEHRRFLGLPTETPRKPAAAVQTVSSVKPALATLSREWTADQKTGATVPGALKES